MSNTDIDAGRHSERANGGEVAVGEGEEEVAMSGLLEPNR